MTVSALVTCLNLDSQNLDSLTNPNPNPKLTSGYAMVVHGRPKTPKNTSFLGVTQPPGVVQPLYSRGHN